MQRSDLESEIGRLCGDPNNTRWLTSIIDTRLDQAVLDVLKWTNATKSANTYTPTASQSGVTVSDNVIDILRGTFTLPNGTIKSERTGFAPKTRWALDFERPNWMNESPGEPVIWSFDATTKQVVLVPAPDASNATANALTLLEVRQPTNTLSAGSGTTVPFDSNALLVPYHRALVYWVVSENLKDNNDSDSLQKARYFRSNDLNQPGEYEKEIKQILMKFDVPEAIPAQVLYQPTGGRLGGTGWPSKRYPFLP